MNRAELLADSLVSIAAITGLLILIDVLRRTGPADAMTRRFLFGLGVLTILLTARVLAWMTGSGIFLFLMYFAAGLVPLSAVMLAEGLLRRHTLRLVKYLLTAGTIAFVLLAFLPSSLVEPGRSYALLAYQFLGFLIAGWMVVQRDRKSLSASENWLVDRITLSLLLILPFLITDFRFDGFDLPVRLAGIAILFTCWLAVGMGRSHLSHRDTIKSFAVLTAAAFVGGLGISKLAGFDFYGNVQTIAVTLSACLVAAIFNDSMNIDADERRNSLLKHIAHGNERDPTVFLQGLREHMLVEGALILGNEELSDFSEADILRIFETDPVRRIAEVRNLGQSDTGLEQLAALFERYDATHLMIISRTPLSLVALNMPSMASAPGAETELRAVQRVAMLISERSNDKN